ncbi:GAF domain-containing protein [Rhodococcus sp. P1Y]|nr:GAF domain-containing protein [Rhodococcus sp. P1Y]
MDQDTAKPVKDRAFLFNTLALVFGIGTAGATLLSRTTEGSALVAVNIAATVLAVLTAVTVFLKSRNEHKVKESLKASEKTVRRQLDETEFRTKAEVNGAFLGASDRLRELSVAKSDKDLTGFLQDVVTATCTLLTNDKPRVGYFQVRDLAAPTRTMKRVASWGPDRLDEFTTDFDEASGTDTNVWRLLTSDNVTYERDIAVHIPDGSNFDGRVYKSYVSIAVRAGGIEMGMLTANTLEVDGFSDVDVAMMRVLARLIAAGEATCMSPQKVNAARSAAERRIVTGPEQHV